MTRILWQTDGWGAEDIDRLELKWPEDHDTSITITDEAITIHSSTFLYAQPDAVNKISITFRKEKGK